MKIVTILGARPQFIKAGTVSREIAKYSQTEWVELAENGFNVFVGADKEKILDAYRNVNFNGEFSIDLYGKGRAGEKIIDELLRGESCI